MSPRQALRPVVATVVAGLIATVVAGCTPAPPPGPLPSAASLSTPAATERASTSPDATTSPSSPRTTAHSSAPVRPTHGAVLVPPPAARPRTTSAPVPAAHTTPPAAPPAAQQLPLPYQGGAGQVITVVAPSYASTTATLTAWQRSGAGWRAVFGPTPAWVGSDGVGQASESLSRTPTGVYTLTQAFGRQPNPGTGLPYFRTSYFDWWDENPNSLTYNEHVVRSSSPGGNSENLYGVGYVYDYVVNIDYNTARTPGAGSAIFLHVTDGSPTAGCVAIGEGSLTAIMRWLSLAQRPVIDIGVG